MFLRRIRLKRFSDVAVDVLGEDDTALDLPSGKRISLQFKKAEQRYFALVREGISEILALSAPLEEEPELRMPSANRVKAVVCAILPAVRGKKFANSVDKSHGRLDP